MHIPDLPGPSAFDDDVDVANEFLEENDGLIKALAWKKVSRSIVMPEVLDLEADELAQESRIKLWQILQKRQITNAKAYVRCVVHSESIDMVRQHKATVPLPMNEDGELNQSSFQSKEREEWQDPAYTSEQAESMAERVAQVVGAVSDLPPRQRLAMIHSLAERVDDLVQLLDAFESSYTDVSGLAEWPDDESEMRRLKASIAPARHTLAQSMDVELPERKKRGVTSTPLFCAEEAETSSD